MLEQSGVSYLLLSIWKFIILGLLGRGQKKHLHLLDKGPGALFSGGAEPVLCPFLPRDSQAGRALASPWGALLSLYGSCAAELIV